MSDTRNYVQGKDYFLSGSGVTLSATSATLTSMEYPDGTAVVMADFGTLGYGTFEPETDKEENFSFTGLTQSANGTATLTGITRGLAFKAPYTADNDLRNSHAGGSVMRITNSAPFYSNFANKGNDETIDGLYTFPSGANNPVIGTVYAAPTSDLQIATKKYADDLAIAGSPNASTTVKGILEASTQAEADAGTSTGGTGAVLAVTPDVLRARKYHDFAASGAGTDTYAITPAPAVTAYADGQVFIFEADVANTGAATLNVSALGAKTIKKYGNKDLVTNDIVAGSIVTVIYDLDSDTFMLQTPIAKQQVSQDGAEIFALDAQGSDTYVITLSPAPTAYTNGQVFHFGANTANAGVATLNVNALGAKTIKKWFNQDLITGDIVAGQLVAVIYDVATDTFQLLSPVSTPTPRIKVGTFAISSSGALAVTGVGFLPKVVQFFYATAPSTGGDQALDVMIGAATSASSEAVIEAFVSDNAGTAASSSSTTASIIIRAGASATTVTEQADFTSLDADGFTLNVSTFTSARTVMYVAIG